LRPAQGPWGKRNPVNSETKTTPELRHSDPADQLATPIAREREALSVDIEDTATNFAVAWMGTYRIEGGLFIYRDRHSGNTRTIFRLSDRY
jgi:hypothetical protein